MDQKEKEILLAILRLAGQEHIATDCGGDFNCEAYQCRHWWDCEDQRKRCNTTFDIKRMIEEA